MLTRQLTKDNNGHLQATEKYLSPYGFGSERTIGRAIRELIAHGFVYRTKSGGFQQGPAKYAVTWLSITRREGIFPQGFKAEAWRNWTSDREKKSGEPEVQPSSGIFGRLTTPAAAKSAAMSPVKTADIELVPVDDRCTALADHCEEEMPL